MYHKYWIETAIDSKCLILHSIVEEAIKMLERHFDAGQPHLAHIIFLQPFNNNNMFRMSNLFATNNDEIRRISDPCRGSARAANCGGSAGLSNAAPYKSVSSQ